jgi:nucleotide-binding universal stress UspA family protein
MKILVASDGSPSSEAAIAEIGRRPWPKGTEIKVLTAFELPVMANQAWSVPPHYFEQMDLDARQHAQTIVDHAAESLKSQLGGKVVVRSEFASGSPQNVILAEANRWGADLIVLGSQGYSSWERLLLGSISQTVVSHARCSVEVVRARGH